MAKLQRVSNDIDIKKGTMQIKSKMKINIQITYSFWILIEKLKMFCCGSSTERDQVKVRKHGIW